MTRIDNDSYPSEPALVLELMKHIKIGVQDIIFEPTAGAGQLASPLKQAGLWVMTNDIAHGLITWECTWCNTINLTSAMTSDYAYEYKMESCSNKRCIRHDDPSPYDKKFISSRPYNCDFMMDAAKQELWQTIPRPAWVIGNPPYNQLDSILENSLAHASIGVAMLLRITALEPTIKRSTRGFVLQSYADQMRYLIPFSAPRPSYTSDGKTDAVTTAWFVWEKGWSWGGYQTMSYKVHDVIKMESPFQFVTNWLVNTETTS